MAVTRCPETGAKSWLRKTGADFCTVYHENLVPKSGTKAWHRKLVPIRTLRYSIE